jgi:hypothetical protein
VWFVSFVVHEHPHSIRANPCSSVVKKTSVASQVCGSGGTSPSPKKLAISFRVFRVFPWFMNIPIPSVLIHVHPWLKKHPWRDRFAAQVKRRPSGPDCVPAHITSQAKSPSCDRRTERKQPPHVDSTGGGCLKSVCVSYEPSWHALPISGDLSEMLVNRFEIDFVTFHFLVQGCAIDAECLGGFLAVPAGAFQSLDDQLAFGLRERGLE